MSAGTFYRMKPGQPWMFVWAGQVEFDFKAFKEDNPEGVAVSIDLDSMSNANPSTFVNDVVLHTIQLNDGRTVDIFPDTGNVQVYTEDHDHSYEVNLPTVEHVTTMTEKLRNQQGPKQNFLIGVNLLG